MGLIAALRPAWIPLVYGSAWLPMSDVMLILYPNLVAMMMILTSPYAEVITASFVFYGAYNVVYWSTVSSLPSFAIFGLPAAEWIA
jgi:hypothetical protein